MNIINIYDNYFNHDLKKNLKACSEVAFKYSYKIYLIGGIVRDMLLNQKSLDIDITVEGDAVEFAHILEKEVNAKISSIHKNFGIAKVEINGYKIDLASTRSESYPKAGHLPIVEKIGCSLKEDVLRRDFTINSLACSLNQDSFADLIDYVGGFDDLKAKKIKILHDKSFVDDPTRIIRALKYSTRLGFELDKKTLKLQEKYLENINYDMCYKRVKQEIKKTFEQNSQKAFEKFIEQGIYKLITPHPIFLTLVPRVEKSPLPQGARVNRLGLLTQQHEVDNERLDRSQNKFGITPGHNIENLIKKYKPKHPWLVYFGILLINENSDKFELTKMERETIESTKNLINKTFSDDFEIYKTFKPQKLETLLILAVLSNEKVVSHYLDDLKKIKLHINGNDLINLGFVPSKKFSEGFDYVLKKKLEKQTMKKAEELELIREFFQEV